MGRRVMKKGCKKPEFAHNLNVSGERSSWTILKVTNENQWMFRSVSSDRYMSIHGGGRPTMKFPKEGAIRKPNLHWIVKKVKAGTPKLEIESGSKTLVTAKPKKNQDWRYHQIERDNAIRAFYRRSYQSNW